MPADTERWEPAAGTDPRSSWDQADMDRERIKESSPGLDVRIRFDAGRFLVEWRR